MAPLTTAEAFGAVLRHLRDAKNITQENLALAAGLDRTVVGDLEKGGKQPSLNTIFQLAMALEVAPGFLVDMAALFKFAVLREDDLQ